MNKQDILKLYIGKCKVNTPNGVQEYWSCDLGTEMIEHTKSNKHGIASNISDCTLLLKRLSSMSEAEKHECRKLMILGQLDKYDCIPKEMFDHNQYRYYHTLNSFIWLINHGYALSDEWFKSQDGNPPIAEEV